MGNVTPAGRNNDELVDNLVNNHFIETDIVSRIFRAVDRANYLLPHDRYRAYLDHACINGHIHLSSPCVYGEVLDALNLKSGLSFLNVGSGTGYLSTMVGLVLGTWGVNHGIEYHEDVITYAYEKLSSFKQTEALDEFEFSDPVFIQGNAFTFLKQSNQLYDRIYCGANCPDSIFLALLTSHLKIGGVLVVPFLDQLHVITNTPTGVQDDFGLAVSFADLIEPDDDEPVLQITEIPCTPISLQCACRSVIRVHLRNKIDIEYPDIAETLKRKQSVAEVLKKPQVRVKVKCMYQEGELDWCVDSDSDCEEVQEEGEEMMVETHDETSDDESTIKGYQSPYRQYLSQKILDLPLPYPLKEYLNYNRCFNL